MKKAVIYSRVSLEQQDFHSQIEDLQRYAETTNIQIVEVFAEKASGYDLSVERTEYDRMKDFVLANSIELIICWELPRFGRKSLQILNEIDFFSKKKVNIYFKKENIYTISDDPMSKLVLNFLANIAEMERNTIIGRSKRGMTSSALRGKRIGFGTLPYGYSSDDKSQIIINKEEAEHVQMMFEMASQGYSLRAIIERLNSLNIPTRKTTLGKKRTLKSGEQIPIFWRRNTVRKILISTLYKGERNYSGGHKIVMPQIVSIELWNRVQTVFETHIACVSTTKYDYLFKGKIYCGNCGYLIATRTEKRYSHLPSYYFCTTRREKGIICKNGQFDSKVFDELVYNQIFKNPGLLEKVYNDMYLEFNIEEKQNQITYFRNQIGEAMRTRKRVNELYIKGFISESEVSGEHTGIKNNIVNMENNIMKIQKEIETRDKADIGNILFQLVEENNFDVKREFVQKYVDRVLMYKVTSNDINWSEQYSGRLEDEHFWEGDIVQLKPPHGNDKLIYVELYIFGSLNPLKITLTNTSKQCYISDKLDYNNGHLTLNQ